MLMVSVTVSNPTNDITDKMENLVDEANDFYNELQRSGNDANSSNIIIPQSSGKLYGNKNLNSGESKSELHDCKRNYKQLKEDIKICSNNLLSARSTVDKYFQSSRQSYNDLKVCKTKYATLLEIFNPYCESIRAAIANAGYILKEAGGYFFVVHNTPTVSWHTARDECAKLGLSLAYGFNSVIKRTHIQNVLGTSYGYYWVGASDFGTEGTFFWIETDQIGSNKVELPASILPYYPGGTAQNCLEIENKPGKFNFDDYGCDTNDEGYICEVRQNCRAYFRLTSC